MSRIKWKNTVFHVCPDVTTLNCPVFQKYLKTMLVTKNFFTENNSEFHNFQLNNKALLKQKYLANESKTLILNSQILTPNTSYIMLIHIINS